MEKDQLIQLKRFIGKWNTTGKIYESEGRPAVSIGGVDRYEWLLDNKFILHQVDVIMGESNHCSLEVICPDLEGKYSKVVAVEADGSTETSKIMVNEHDINILGDRLRFKGKFDEEFRQIKGCWQQINGQEEWIDFMEIQLDKDLEENGNGLH